MSDQKRQRSINIELVSRSLFLSNIAAIPTHRTKVERLRSEFPRVIATGKTRKILDAATALQDAERATSNSVGTVNRHFRKALRAFQIHNGDAATMEVFTQVATIFPDVAQSDTEALSQYFSVLGEDQDEDINQ